MARPIEPTPALEGQDAERLLASLKSGASDSEMAQRADSARKRVAQMMTAKPQPQHTEKPPKK